MSAHKTLKINNSYESELSNGSSLIEQLEYNTENDENMHLPHIVKPPSYETEIIIPANGNIYVKSQENKMSASLPDMCDQRTNNLETIASPLQSQESIFKGFTESPYGKLQRKFFSSSTSLIEQPMLPFENVASKIKNKNKQSKSKDSLMFSRFYDMAVDENSCNAVDLKLSNDEPIISACKETQKDGTDCLISICKEPLSKPFRLSIELSFNGKIKSLTPPKEDECNIEIKKQTQNQSFILKKYSNEKSPDLFGDNEDDDEGEVEDNYNDEEKYLKLDEPVRDFCMIESIQNPSYVDETLGSQNITETQEQSAFLREDYTCDMKLKKIEHEVAYSLFRENCRREKELLRRIRKCLSGIPPPPSLTIPQLDIFSAVIDRKQELLNFANDSNTVNQDECSSSSNTFTSLLKPTHSIDEAMQMGWRQVLGVRQHGLCFNLCKASENNEYLGLSVIERFIGAETASSYRNSPSSAKKRNARLKLLAQSPGNRLSHLARRRATFSSVQLATQKTNNLRGTQILVEVKKKNKHRRKNTPKRKTPGSKRKTRKTPSSSARKKIFRCDLIIPGPSREASKRALFQSPPKQLDQRPTTQRLIPSIKPEIANRVEKSKRALFSPDKKNESVNPSDYAFNINYSSQLNYEQQSNRFSTFTFDSILKRKRSALEDDDTGDSADLPSQSNKLFGGGAENLTPRALKIKSQSFCIGSSTPAMLNNASTNSSLTNNVPDSARNLISNGNLGLSSSSAKLNITNTLCSGLASVKIQRAHSDMVAQTTSTLTENQRKKLLWAVSQALQEKKVTTKHERFKDFAAVLARVVRRIFQEFFQKSSTSNSETLLRLAKRYVHYVIVGRSADEIYLQAKTKITRERNESSCRLSGYIGPEEYERLKKSQQQDDQIIALSQNSNSNIVISAESSSLEPYYFIRSNETEFSGKVSHCQSHSQLNDSSSTMAASSFTKLSIQPDSSLQNSSSKNNMCGLALRENVNFESDQRRSAQKNFTGKDQRNVSPYAKNNNTHCNNNNQLKTINSSQGIKCTNSVVISQMQVKNILSDSSLLHLSTKNVKRQISFDN